MEKVGVLAVASIAVSYGWSLYEKIKALVDAPTADDFYSILHGIVPYAGLVMIYVGRRMLARSARTITKVDDRPPVLYLRSFNDDLKDTLTPSTSLAAFYALTMPHDLQRYPLPLRVLFELQPMRLVRSLFGYSTPTNELQLAGYFRPLGPFVAIGRPGEVLALPGADRDFVSDADWKQTVLDYLERCRFVVLQPAGTKGFRWELYQVLSRAEPRKILLCLTNYAGRQNDYEDLRLTAESVEGWRLPRSVGNLLTPQFLFFRDDRTPVLHEVSYLSPLLWPFLSCVADLDHTLAGFVDRERDAPAYAPRSFPGAGVRIWLLTTIVGPLAGGFLLYFALLAADRGYQPKPEPTPQVQTGLSEDEILRDLIKGEN